MSAVPEAKVELRALLLLLTALAIAGMHTLGHPGKHASARVISAHAAPAAQPHASGLPADVAALPAIAMAELPSLPRDGLDPTQACLAVLTLAGLALLVAAALFAVRRHAAFATPVTAAGACWRAPPPPSIGLVLTDLSVLRT